MNDTATEPTPIPYHRVEAMYSTDFAKRDLELVCLECPLEDNPVLCDVEAGDTLDVLMDIFADHWVKVHADAEQEV